MVSCAQPLPIFVARLCHTVPFHSTSAVCAGPSFWAASRAGAFAGIWSTWSLPYLDLYVWVERFELAPQAQHTHQWHPMSQYH